VVKPADGTRRSRPRTTWFASMETNNGCEQLPTRKVMWMFAMLDPSRRHQQVGYHDAGRVAVLRGRVDARRQDAVALRRSHIRRRPPPEAE
jgi:hypothetical protein